MSGEMSTREKVLHFGKQEFLQKGYQNASLRNIAAEAGMTTGAIYTYFADKNALFEAIVAPVCEQVEWMFKELSKSYYTDNGVVGEITAQKTLEDLYRVYDMIYRNYDSFRILIVGAEGSSKADYLHTIVGYEVEQTIAYLDRMMKGRGVEVKVNPALLHTIAESYINTLMEPVRHGMSYEEAVENLDLLCAFFTGGWQSIFRRLFGE